MNHRQVRYIKRSTVYLVLMGFYAFWLGIFIGIAELTSGGWQEAFLCLAVICLGFITISALGLLRYRDAEKPTR